MALSQPGIASDGEIPSSNENSSPCRLRFEWIVSKYCSHVIYHQRVLLACDFSHDALLVFFYCAVVT